MKSVTFGIVVCLQLMVATLSFAADIIWVHEGRGGGGMLAWEDDQWRALIEGQGHSILRNEAFNDIGALSLEEFDMRVSDFNEADLVIFSRDTASGGYNDPPEHEFWTSGFTTPMIIMSPYLLRDNRWGMVQSSSIVDVASPMLATEPDHPIFNGVALDEAGQVEVWSQLGEDDNIDLVDTTDFGFAQVIAEESDTGIPWIAYWDGETSDGDFFDGSFNFAAGPRLFLSAGSDDDPNTWGEKNITPAGDQIVLNAIEFLTGDPGNPVVTCMPGNGDLDGDGMVAFADFLILSAAFGSEAGPEQGDIDCDGSVAFSDFLTLSANFGQAVGTASAVPEPAGSWLLALGMIGIATRRRDLR